VKVCILTPEFLPAWGGIGTYTYNLARGLRDHAEVHVLTGALSPGYSGLDGVDVHPAFPVDGGWRDVSPIRFQAAVFRRLPRLMKAHGFDIVHANHAYMSDLLVRLRRGRTSNVVTVHTTLDTQVGGTLRAGASAPRQGLEGSLARWRFLLQAVERRYLRRTRAMIFVSRWVRDQTLDRYRVTPRLSAVVPNAIDTERLNPDAGSRGRDASASNRPTLLFAGRLLALKGIDTLLRAMTRVDDRVRLKLAGPGDQTPWKSLAKDLGLSEDRCEFLGRVPYPEMPYLYRDVDAVVLPSFTESCPLVALEAMASGTPIVAADVGGVSEVVQDGETGWLFPAGSVDGLASRIDAVLSDPAGARRVTAKARTWVEENATIARMADRTFAFYERFLQGEAS
jgi:glycosyltransferase involved in cell wall biosynthesis